MYVVNIKSRNFCDWFLFIFSTSCCSVVVMILKRLSLTFPQIIQDRAIKDFKKTNYCKFFP